MVEHPGARGVGPGCGQHVEQSGRRGARGGAREGERPAAVQHDERRSQPAYAVQSG